MIIVKNIAGNKCPPARSSSAVANLRPTPVLVTTPIMTPAVAQAIKTPRTPLEPSIKPLTTSPKLIRVDFLRQEQIRVRPIAHKAARIGV